MPTKLRNAPFILAALLAVYGAAGIFAGHAVRAWRSPDWLQELSLGLFAAPLLILCRPWFPLLTKLGLMRGGLVQVPSAAGTALVVGIYVVVLVVAGILLGRRRG